MWLIFILCQLVGRAYGINCCFCVLAVKVVIMGIVIGCSDGMYYVFG
jgi:hypothetical protein